ncbi:MAG: hypothetical protein IJM44_07490 [Ruminococcus sp.]|nr:hypothetical protein [Ruminococcus sp.]
MKKALTIGGIVLGILLVGWLAIVIFCPGLFTYISVKHKYEHIDDRLSTFAAVQVPSDFVTYTVGSVKISVPSSYSQGSTEHILRDGDKVVMIMDFDNAELAGLSSELLKNWGMEDEFSESDYRSYFKAVGAEYPSVYKPSADILWYEKDVLTSKDCLKLRGRDRKVFKTLADNKEEAYKMEDSWKLPLSGGTAYASQSRENDLVNYAYWTATIYPDNSGAVYYTLMIRGESDEVTKQMLSSIELK